MKPGSIVELRGQAGDHGMLNGNKCPGRQFQVVQAGVGGIYENLVRCTQCHLDLVAYGNQVVDPFAQSFLEGQGADSALYGIRTTYRFRHHNSNAVDSNPDLWFISEANANSAFSQITREAAMKAWPVKDHLDVLESATVSVGVREKNAWRELQKKTFKADANR